MFARMNTVLDRRWTTVAFGAWENEQELQHECNRQRGIPMSATRVVRQRVMRHSRMAFLPTVPQAGAMTAPDPGFRSRWRSVPQGLTFAT